MHPIQSEMLAKVMFEDRHREAARLRSIRRLDEPTWRARVGARLVRAGCALQGAGRDLARGPVGCPQLAADPC